MDVFSCQSQNRCRNLLKFAAVVGVLLGCGGCHSAQQKWPLWMTGSAAGADREQKQVTVTDPSEARVVDELASDSAIIAAMKADELAWAGFANDQERIDVESNFRAESASLTEVSPLASDSANPRSQLSSFKTAALSRSVAMQAKSRPAAPHELLSDERATIELTVEEAIELAIKQNRFVRVERYTPSIAQRQIVIEDSYFHPLFQLGVQYSETDTQIANVVDGPGVGVSSSGTNVLGPPRGMSDQVRLSQKTRTGGEISGSLSSVYTFTDPPGSFLTINPSIKSQAQMEISHPFLRGAGRDVAMTQVRVAADLNQAARCRLEIAVTSTASQTAGAYWDLYEARARLESRTQGVVEAHNALERETEKLRLGASSQPEVAAVREQLERFRVNLTMAEGDVADRERRLRTLIGMPREDGTIIKPTSRPLEEPPVLNWEEAVDLAEYRRAEIRLQRILVQAASREERRADNFTLPDINGYAGVSVSGNEDDLSRSWQTLTQGQYGSWWAGVMYQKQLGRCRDRASLDQARLRLAQQRASCIQVEDAVLDELHAAHQETVNAWRAVQMTNSQRLAASEVLDARREMHELGAISVQDYLMALSIWNQSLADQQSAISQYNSALMKWQAAQGTLLCFAESASSPSASSSQQAKPPVVSSPVFP